MTMELIYGMPENLKLPPSLHEACRQPHLMVNLQGERFMNEAVMLNPTYTGNAIALQKDRCAFLIFDAAIKQKMEIDLDTKSVVFPITRFDEADASIQKVLQSGYPHFFKADTIEELAQKLGIREDALIETIDDYNQHCVHGYDALFNKPQRYLRPLTQAPFYTARHFPCAYGTLGLCVRITG